MDIHFTGFKRFIFTAKKLGSGDATAPQIIPVTKYPITDRAVTA
jgi:hypothetical protein